MGFFRLAAAVREEVAGFFAEVADLRCPFFAPD
jgi:hypothetical protein